MLAPFMFNDCEKKNRAPSRWLDNLILLYTFIPFLLYHIKYLYTEAASLEGREKKQKKVVHKLQGDASASLNRQKLQTCVCVQTMSGTLSPPRLPLRG